MKLLFLSILVLSGCSKKPLYIWYNNRCEDQWIEYEDGFHYSTKGGAANASRLSVPCKSEPDNNGELVWHKVPYH